jgi:hypothetical protein
VKGKELKVEYAELIQENIQETMEVKKLYIVGDKFKSFSKNPNVMPISLLEESVMFADLTQIQNQVYMAYIGQGIDFGRVETLRKRIAMKGLDQSYQLKMAENFKATHLLTHKYKLENIMISDPEQYSDSGFTSMLMLDDNCAEMSDHVTGQHLQGMVLIEAARQMTLAVTEKFYINPENRGKMSFVTDSLSTEFKSYLFPLEVELLYSVNKVRGFEENKRFDTTIQFIQNGKVCTEVKYGFSVFKPEFVDQKEQQLAINTINVGLAA